MDGLNSHYFP